MNSMKYVQFYYFNNGKFNIVRENESEDFEQLEIGIYPLPSAVCTVRKRKKL